jgi:hypothetical protein
MNGKRFPLNMINVRFENRAQNFFSNEDLTIGQKEGKKMS